MGHDRQDGAEGQRNELQAVTVTSDGSAVLAGFTGGDWRASSHIGYLDFAAVKLAFNGSVIWKWQVYHGRVGRWVGRWELILRRLIVGGLLF